MASTFDNQVTRERLQVKRAASNFQRSGDVQYPKSNSNKRITSDNVQFQDLLGY